MIFSLCIAEMNPFLSPVTIQFKNLRFAAGTVTGTQINDAKRLSAWNHENPKVLGYLSFRTNGIICKLFCRKLLNLEQEFFALDTASH